MPDTLTAAVEAPTAIIDVGSNSVRLVIFGRCTRAPLTMINEKAVCGLGQGVSENGHLNAEGVEQAIATINRFVWLSKRAGVRRIVAFATAAVRDAGDGPAFIERVRRETGQELSVLSGEQEARLAGLGVLYGIPDADGVVADMGGSSLELVSVKDGGIQAGQSLPLGPLQFSRDGCGPMDIRLATDAALKTLDWLPDVKGRTLYMVGGTWRAFAKLDIGDSNYALNIIHSYEMTAKRAVALAQLVAQQSPDSLIGDHGISKRRLMVLPNSAIVLGRLVSTLQPSRLVFSAHGVREGAYFSALSPEFASQDPLLAGAAALAREEARFGANAGIEISEWIEPLFEGETPAERRLRIAACTLCDVGWRTHPDYRATQSFRRILRSPLVAVTHPERCYLALAVLRRYSHKAADSTVDDARTVLTEEQIRKADILGASMRLALTLGGGTQGALAGTSLRLEDARLTLTLPEDRTWMVGEAVESRLRQLAYHFDAGVKIIAD